MAREIKFRCWDKTEGCWLGGEAIRRNAAWGVSKGAEGELTFGAFIDFMQYTGLKDKNGKEIYEGDLVKVKPSFTDQILKVQWQNGGFNLQGNAVVLHLGCNDIPPIHVEVIGNIYETPTYKRGKT